MRGAVAGSLHNRHTGRIVLLAVAVVLAAIVVSTPLHALLVSALDRASTIISEHPRLGVIVFVLFSALSAMMVFMSSVVLVPIAIYTWGERTALVLLWLGWFAGGVAAYTIGRKIGRTMLVTVLREKFTRYEQRVSADATFGKVLIFFLSVPSELPGYVMGLLRYPFKRFLAVLAIAEIPFAVLTIYAGESFLQRNVPMLLLLGVLAVAVIVLLRKIEARWERTAATDVRHRQ
jgi:uncharacterized membrane protein YdjX (TVP38/TMEM64 family)